MPLEQRLVEAFQVPKSGQLNDPRFQLSSWHLMIPKDKVPEFLRSALSEDRQAMASNSEFAAAFTTLSFTMILSLIMAADPKAAMEAIRTEALKELPGEQQDEMNRLLDLFAGQKLELNGTTFYLQDWGGKRRVFGRIPTADKGEVTAMPGFGGMLQAEFVELADGSSFFVQPLEEHDAMTLIERARSVKSPGVESTEAPAAAAVIEEGDILRGPVTQSVAETPALPALAEARSELRALSAEQREVVVGDHRFTFSGDASERTLAGNNSDEKLLRKILESKKIGTPYIGYRQSSSRRLYPPSG